MSKAKIGNLLNSSYEHAEEKAVSQLVTSNHCVGVELEVENFRYNFEGSDSPRIFHYDRLAGNIIGVAPQLPLWRIVKDNSLRNGAEFVFATPHRGKDIVDALDSIQKLINKYRYNNTSISVTDRCSVHVHLDVRDLDEKRLFNLLMVYVLVERILFKHVHYSRVKSTYCRPLTDSDFVNHLSNYLTKFIQNPKESLDTYGTLKSLFAFIEVNCDKYSALNLLPIRRFGSIEFRHHEGCLNMQKVLDWINIILSIKLASFYEPQHFLELYDTKGPIGLLKYIFSDTVLASDEFLNDPETPFLVHKGINDYQYILNYVNLTSAVRKTKPNLSLPFPFLESFFSFNQIGEEVKRPRSRPKPKSVPDEVWFTQHTTFDASVHQFHTAVATAMQTNNPFGILNPVSLEPVPTPNAEIELGLTEDDTLEEEEEEEVPLTDEDDFEQEDD